MNRIRTVLAATAIAVVTPTRCTTGAWTRWGSSHEPTRCSWDTRGE